MTGLRTWRADGSLRWDIGDRMSRITHFFDTGTTDGSVAVAPGLTPFFYVHNPRISYPDIGPKVAIVGNAVTWTFRPEQQYRWSVTLIVGGY